MPISGTGKAKLQSVVGRLEAGSFDANDVDNLLIALRPYAGDNRIFREAADFVAHRDKRDRGTVQRALKALYLVMTYFVEYVSPRIKLNLAEPFPAYIFDLMILETEKCDSTELKRKFSVSPERLKTRIKKSFRVDQKLKLCHLKKPLSSSIAAAVQHLLGAIRSYPVFSGQELVDEMIQVLRENDIPHDESVIQRNGDKICLCVLLLLHHTMFDYQGREPGRTEICCGRSSVPVGENNVDLTDLDLAVFEHLQANGTVTVSSKGKPVEISFPIMTTSLPVADWVDPSLFSTRDISDELAEPYDAFYVWELDFPPDLLITNEFKLGRVAA